MGGSTASIQGRRALSAALQRRATPTTRPSTHMLSCKCARRRGRGLSGQAAYPGCFLRARLAVSYENLAHEALAELHERVRTRHRLEVLHYISHTSLLEICSRMEICSLADGACQSTRRPRGLNDLQMARHILRVDGGLDHLLALRPQSRQQVLISTRQQIHSNCRLDRDLSAHSEHAGLGC